MRLRPATARSAIPASAALHLLDRPARTETDLDLDDLELVHIERAQDPGQPLARPFHVRRPTHVTAVGRSISSSPATAR